MNFFPNYENACLNEYHSNRHLQKYLTVHRKRDLSRSRHVHEMTDFSKSDGKIRNWVFELQLVFLWISCFASDEKNPDLPLPPGDNDSSKASLEFWRFSSHQIQPMEIVIKMPLDVGNIKSFSKCPLEGTCSPYCRKYGCILIPYRPRNKTVNIFCIDPHLKK